MINLIKFELLKEIHKKSFMIFILMIISVSFLTSFLVSKKDYNYTYSNINKINAKTNIEKEYNKLINDNNLKVDYYTSSNKEYNNKTKHNLEYVYSIMLFLVVVMIIISSSIMSAEYSKKTINLLLIKPYSRYKVFFSKIITLLIILMLFLCLLLISYMLSTFVFNNYKDIFIPTIDVINNKVIERNYIVLFLKNYLFLSIPVVFIILLTYSISIITKNTAVTTSISMFILLSGLIISTFLLSVNINFVEYTFLPYLDFTIFLDKINIMEFNINNNCNLNIIKGMIILCMYSFLFIIGSLYYFIKKDVNC